MNKKIVLGIAAILLLALVGVGIYKNLSKNKEKDVIKIGAILPLTGDAAEFGNGNKTGIELAIIDINDKGGINGKIVEMIYEDSKNNPTTAITIYNKIRALNSINSLFSCMSSVSLALKPLTEQDKLVTFCVAAAPELTKESKYIYRLLPTTNIQALKIGEFLKQQNNKNEKIALLSIVDDFGNSFKESFRGIAQQTGLNIVSENDFRKDGTNFRNIITKTLSKSPTIFVIGGYGSALGVLIKQIREQGFNGTIYGTPDMGYPKVLEVVGNNIGNAYVIDFDIDKSKPEVENFINKYKSRFIKEPSMDAFLGYDGINILIKAQMLVEQKKMKSLKDALLSIKEFNGITGKITILEDGDIIFPLKFRKL